MLQVIWNHKTMDRSEARTVKYADIWVHKELLRWYVLTCICDLILENRPS